MRPFLEWLSPAVLAAAAALPQPTSAGEVVTNFKEVDDLHRNPGQGWMSFGRMPGREPRLPCSVAYFRLDWADLEPEEGKPAWKPVDEAIAAWKARGARVAFRIMTANAHSGGTYSSPKWLFDAGCKSYEYTEGGSDPTKGGKRIPRVEPDYADPLCLKKHGAFLRALGARYDGHPDVEFLDIGSYGIWGEWHTPHPAPIEVRRRIVDLYVAAFQKTPLVVTLINDNVGDVPPEKMPELQRLARRAGYRFVLREVRHAGSAPRGAPLAVDMKWSNVGVGKLYRKHVLRLALLDDAGAVACASDGKADPREWLPGDKAVQERLAIPAALQPGPYALAVGLVDPDTGKPAIRLAIDAPETDRWHRVSRVTVR